MKILFNVDHEPCLAVERAQWPDRPEEAIQLVFGLNYLPPGLYKISLLDEHNQHDYKKLLYDSHDSDVSFNLSRLFDCPLYEKAVFFFERKVHKVNLFFIVHVSGGRRESFEAEVEPRTSVLEALHSTHVFARHPDLNSTAFWSTLTICGWKSGPVDLNSEVEAEQLYIVDFVSLGV